jgi:hypothetical protein
LFILVRSSDPLTADDVARMLLGNSRLLVAPCGRQLARRWLGVTQQYLAGELSVILGELQAATASPVAAGDVTELRHEAETTPVAALPSVTGRALALTDRLCWDSLDRADTVTFSRQATIGAELYEFGVCAGLLVEERGRDTAGPRTNSNRG